MPTFLPWLATLVFFFFFIQSRVNHTYHSDKHLQTRSNQLPSGKTKEFANWKITILNLDRAINELAMGHGFHSEFVVYQRRHDLRGMIPPSSRIPTARPARHGLRTFAAADGNSTQLHSRRHGEWTHISCKVVPPNWELVYEAQ